MSDDAVGGRARLAQERSRARRDQLIAAAAQLFTEGGTKAITHRSVSELAEVPLATVSYYFDSIEQLIEVLFSQTLTAWAALAQELHVPDDGHVEPADVSAQCARLLRKADPAGYARELRIYLSALNRPAMIDQVMAMQGTTYQAFAELVSAAGVEQTAPVVSRILMVFTGALVSITSPGADVSRAADEAEKLITLVMEDALQRERPSA